MLQRSHPLLWLALVLGSPSLARASGVDPRTPVDSLPGSATALHVIDAPGSYVLRGNLVGAPGKHGILVSASDVTIALNGFLLLGSAGALSGIHDGGASLENIAVFDGRISGWPGAGLSLAGTRYGIVDGVSASANGSEGMHLGKDFLVSDFAISQNAGYGILAGFGGCFVDGSVRSNGPVGLWVNDSAFGEGGSLVADCDFQDSALWPGKEALVARCEFETTSTSVNQFLVQPGPGCIVTRCRLRAPTFSNAGTGLYANHTCLVFENEFHGFGYGISTSSSRSWFHHNTFTECGTGLLSNGANLVTNNTTGTCATDFSLSSANSYGQILAPVPNYFSDAKPWANIVRP